MAGDDCDEVMELAAAAGFTGNAQEGTLHANSMDAPAALTMTRPQRSSSCCMAALHLLIGKGRAVHQGSKGSAADGHPLRRPPKNLISAVSLGKKRKETPGLYSVLHKGIVNGA